MATTPFEQAVELIDAANAGDPARVVFEGQSRAKEPLHAELLTDWVRRLVAEPSEDLLLAARGHHIRRWEHPRSEFEPGRRGYLRWRTGLYTFHTETTTALLRQAGYAEERIAAVASLIAKRRPPGDPEAQALEDGVCLVFLQTQFDELSSKVDRDKMVDILRKTWRKMSPAGRAAALELAFEPAEAALVAEALGMDAPTEAGADD